MGILEKVKFWKKEEKESELPGTPFPGAEPSPQATFGQEPIEQPGPFETKPPSPFEAPPRSPLEPPSPFEESLSVGPSAKPQQAGGRDLEVISLKLDAIKNTLESINLRLERLEQAAGIHDRR